VAVLLLAASAEGVVEEVTVAAEEAKSATSVAKLDTLLEIVLKAEVLEVTGAVPVADTVAEAILAEADTEVEAEVEVPEDRRATPAVVTDTCLGIALKGKSATTVAKLAIYLVTALRISLRNASATSANNLDTSRLLAPIREDPGETGDLSIGHQDGFWDFLPNDAKSFFCIPLWHI